MCAAVGAGIEVDMQSMSKRQRADSSKAGRASELSPSTGIEIYLHRRYGPVLGNALHRMLRGGDLFKEWRAHQDLRPDRTSSSSKEEYARQSAIKGASPPPSLHPCIIN